MFWRTGKRWCCQRERRKEAASSLTQSALDGRFLYNRSRCRNESLCVDQVAMHSMLAERSLNVMSVLRKNICDLKSPGTMVEDVEPAVITEHLSRALQYSCRYWLDHSEHGQVSLDDDGPVYRFLRKYCPYWLEAMSLIGKCHGMPRSWSPLQEAQG
jgi:hypothetical protein